MPPPLCATQPTAASARLLDDTDTGSQDQAAAACEWPVIDYDRDIQLHGKLGSGSFGTVFRASWRGQQVAVKLVPLMADEERYCSKSLDALKLEIQVARGWGCGGVWGRGDTGGGGEEGELRRYRKGLGGTGRV